MVGLANQVEPCVLPDRGITGPIQAYRDNHSLYFGPLGRVYVCLDAGAHESLLGAALFFGAIDLERGYKNRVSLREHPA